METNQKRKAPFLWLFSLTMLIFACTIVIFAAFRDHTGVNTLRAALARVDDKDIRAAFAEMAEKNPETLDYIKSYNGVTPYPDKVDLSEELNSDGIPLLMQWDTRWGYCKYGAGLVGYTGCGPTALSMVLVGLTRDDKYNPAYIAKFAAENGYCVVGNGTSWELFSKGAQALGLTAKELPLDEGTMKRELAAGRPIICIMGKGDFTDTGHYIVITGEKDGKFKINDPYRHETSEKLWDYEKLKPQIRNLWSYEV